MKGGIERIEIEGDRFNNYQISYNGVDDDKRLNKLAKINVFVGENNSGKSRLMRGIASQEYLTLFPAVSTVAAEELKLQLLEALQNAYTQYNLTSMGIEFDILSQVRESDILTSRPETKDFLGGIESAWSYISNGKTRETNYESGTRYVGQDPRPELLAHLFQQLTAALQEKYLKARESFPQSGFQFAKLYIPAIRGLRPFEGGQDMYLERTKRDYFQKGFSPDIFTGLDLYNHVKNLLLGDLAEREIVAEFQAFLSDAFFGGKGVALIPRRDKDVLYVKIGNENEFPIYDLGDGIQSIIVMTFPLFERADDKLLVFIEEPEMYLHPGFQRVLVNTLLKFDNHQFFMTTHSNHFLDLTLDYEQISIYAFRKQLGDAAERVIHPKFEVENVSNLDC